MPLPSKIIDLKWAGGANDTTNEKYVFALTADVDGFDGGPLLRSDNYGKPESWKDMTPVLEEALRKITQETTMLGITELHWHPARPARILFQGKGRYHFVSEDYGATVKAVNSPQDTLGYAQEILTHPRRQDWLLAKVRRDECMLDRRSQLCAYDLFVSQDFAGTWTNLTAQSKGRISSFRDFDWGAKMAMFAGEPTPDETIFATVYQSASAQKGMYPGWDKDLHYVVSTDFFKSPVQKQVPCGNIFEVVAHKVFLAVPSDCPVGPDGKQKSASRHSITGRTVTMYVSDADGDDFEEACLPTSLEDDGYNLVTTQDGYGAFILADHAEEGSRGASSDSPVSDIYAPAYNASLYTLAVQNVYRRDYIVDFTRVDALPGVYLANAVDDEALGPQSRSGARAAEFLRTKITYTGGSTWEQLGPPAAFRFSQCNTCTPGAEGGQCRLHLHGPTSWFAPEGPRPNVYASKSAPGLILATGNVGAHLDFGSAATCTYLSRDAGRTWEDVAGSPAIYEIGAHGDVVVMAAHKSVGPTDRVQFTLDQGSCWMDVKLPEAIAVDNIRVSPSGGGHVFVVHGQACVRTEEHPSCTFVGGEVPPSRMFVLDLKELMQGDWKECNTSPGSLDFEPWTMGGADTCLLGSKHTMQRRKRDVACVTPPDFKPQPPQVEACNCTEADIECEFGYQRVEGKCAPIPGLEFGICQSLDNGGYTISKTRTRLVHADQCVGLKGLINDTDGKGDWSGGGGGGSGGGGGGCHGHSKSSGWKSFFIFVLLTGILLTVGGVVWVHCLPGGLKEDLLAKAAPVLGVLGALAERVLDLVISTWDWARAKVAGFRSGAGSEARAAYFEPLADRLELDPEDHTSPPLFGNR